MSFFRFDLFLNTFFGSLIFILLIIQGVGVYTRVVGHSNQLCVGECFDGLREFQDKKYIKIPPELSPDLDYQTREEIISLRQSRVMEQEKLLRGIYQPSQKIFGQIAGKLRWWGMDGYYQHLRSADLPTWSMAGRSLRGEEIYNPFYLISFKPLTYTVENPNFKWSKEAVPAISGSLCPYVPRKSDVLWKPGERKAEVVYFMKEFIDVLSSNNCLESELRTQEISVGLDPVNAQDMGFSYLSFSHSDSNNVSFSELEEDIIALQFYYHRGTSCRIPEGCNNISPLVRDLFGRIKTKALPARINSHLWVKAPADADAQPDFRYIIHLR